MYMLKSKLPIPPAYNDLANSLFMLQMSYICPDSVDVTALMIKIDAQIAIIHANRILETIKY